MPLCIVRGSPNAALWGRCAGTFLDQVGGCRGPDDYPAHLWLVHRCQRDALLRLAVERGIPGWLAPPFSFFSELRALFRIRERPIGLLTGRLLVARTAARTEADFGPGTPAGGGPTRAHMLDRVFSELLPEGIPPSRLREALRALGGDAFALRRNRWVADTYEAFLEELRRRDRYDPRSIHALVAERIEKGELREALRGARILHVYGITSLRGRRRLFRALADQDEVEVTVYLPAEGDLSEWEELGGAREVLLPPGPIPVQVQPAPDPLREVRWIARQVKRLLVEEETPAHEIAVVARSGERDARLAARALEAAGVPVTARLRTRLLDVPVLRALLSLFGGVARGWPYRSLRTVLASPYFGFHLDLRTIDEISQLRRVEGLDEWREALERRREAETGGRTETSAGDRWRALGLRTALAELERLREAVRPLASDRSEREWIELTLRLLAGESLPLRRRLCEAASDRWDLVRLDQRSVLAVESLLREWRDLVEEGPALGPAEWYDRLRRLFEGNALALSTPAKTGVQVLEAHEAALTPFRHVFLMHANDGVFPRIPSSGGVFSDAEQRRLWELGLPMTDRDRALRREHVLWHAVTAGEQVTVSYRTTDGNGIPRLPSLLVPPHDPASELPRTFELETNAGEPVSPEGHLRRELVQLADLRRAGNTEPVRVSAPERIRHALLNAFAEELRTGGLDGFARSPADLLRGRLAALPPGTDPGDRDAAPEPPEEGSNDARRIFAVERPLSEQAHPWNGWIRDPVVLRHLEERFGEGYVWSATQLQQYAIRPFDFLLERVLRLAEWEEAEEETTPLTFGSVAHAILERFYREILPELPPTLDAETAERLDGVCEEVFRQYEADVDQWLGLPPLWAVTRGEVQDRIREFVARDLATMASGRERPVHLEHAFGIGGSEPVRLEGEDREGRRVTLLLRGRIDRIDRCGEGKEARLRVIDYKSGSVPSKAGYADGSLLQTALYMKAAERLGLGTVEEGAFRSIKQTTRNGAKLERARLEEVLAFAFSIPARVRSGRFEAVHAASSKIARWQPGREVTRSEARLGAGSRFDPVYGNS